MDGFSIGEPPKFQSDVCRARFSLAGFPVADFLSGSPIMVFCRGCSARVIIPGEDFPTGFPFGVSGEGPGRGFRWQVSQGRV